MTRLDHFPLFTLIPPSYKEFWFPSYLWYKKHKGDEKSICGYSAQDGNPHFKFQFDGNPEIMLSFLMDEDLLFQGKTMEDRDEPQRESAT